MEHTLLTLDFWQDNVNYEGKTIPTGALACAVLNLSDEIIAKLSQLCMPQRRAVPWKRRSSLNAVRLNRSQVPLYVTAQDEDGEENGEIRFDFENGTAEIVRLAEWDTIRSNGFAKQVILCVMQSRLDEPPKIKLLAF